MTGQIGSSIGGKDAREDAEMLGDPVRQGGVGCGGEVERAAFGLLLLQILEQFAVVGQMGGVQLHCSGDVALQRGFALGEPAGKPQQFGGVVPGERQGGIDQRVGLYEGAIEIDAEHSGGGRIERGVRGQSRVLPVRCGRCARRRRVAAVLPGSGPAGDLWNVRAMIYVIIIYSETSYTPHPRNELIKKR